jgi:hypothetical protein
VEHGYYNPKYFVGNSGITNGLVPMKKMTDRTYLPTGRPQEYSSNLVSLQPDTGMSIKSDSVIKGYASLGHLHNISKPTLKFEKIKARDNEIYMQTDMLRNVLRDNENIMTMLTDGKSELNKSTKSNSVIGNRSRPQTTLHQARSKF